MFARPSTPSTHTSIASHTRIHPDLQNVVHRQDSPPCFLLQWTPLQIIEAQCVGVSGGYTIAGSLHVPYCHHSSSHCNIGWNLSSTSIIAGTQTSRNCMSRDIPVAYVKCVLALQYHT